jgi:hypothetical protein
MGKLQEYLTRKYGFSVESNDRQVALNAVLAVPVTVNNPDRVGVIFMNTTANIIYIGLNSAVAVGNGISLAAGIGQANFTADEDGDLPTRQWWAISAAGVPNLYVVEMEATQ